MRCGTSRLFFPTIGIVIHVTTGPLESQRAVDGTISDVRMDDVNEHCVSRVQSGSSVIKIKSRSRRIQTCNIKKINKIIITWNAIKRVLLYSLNIAPKNFAFAGTKRAIPSGQDRPILPVRIANQNTGFASSCLLVKPAI